MLVLPAFSLLAPAAKVPHVARTVAQAEIPNEHGTLVSYKVKQARRGNQWWIYSSIGMYKHSNTLRTDKPEIGAQWIEAVQSANVTVARD